METNPASYKDMFLPTSVSATKWDVIRNEELENIVTSIRRRRLRWVGHTLRTESSNAARQALDYHPQGERKVRRPRNNWKQSMPQELERLGYSREGAKALAKNLVCCRVLVDALCSPGGLKE